MITKFVMTIPMSRRGGVSADNGSFLLLAWGSDLQ